MSDLDPRDWPDESNPTVAVLIKLVQDSIHSYRAGDSPDILLRHIELARRALLPEAIWVSEEPGEADTNDEWYRR